MELSFATATPADAASLAALHCAAAEQLTRQYGQGRWSCLVSEQVVLNDVRIQKSSRVVVARLPDSSLAGTFRLATTKPWAIDVSHFTAARHPLYLTSMAVHPNVQRLGIGRRLLSEAERMARVWPADVIRLDAFDAEAGAGPFYKKCGYREVAHAAYKHSPLIYFEYMLEPAGSTKLIGRHAATH